MPPGLPRPSGSIGFLARPCWPWDFRWVARGLAGTGLRGWRRARPNVRGPGGLTDDRNNVHNGGGVAAAAGADVNGSLTLRLQHACRVRVGIRARAAPAEPGRVAGQKRHGAGARESGSGKRKSAIELRRGDRSERGRGAGAENRSERGAGAGSGDRSERGAGSGGETEGRGLKIGVWCRRAEEPVVGRRILAPPVALMRHPVAFVRHPSHFCVTMRQAAVSAGTAVRSRRVAGARSLDGADPEGGEENRPVCAPWRIGAPGRRFDTA